VPACHLAHCGYAGTDGPSHGPGENHACAVPGRLRTGVARSAFDRLVAEVGLGHVGIVLAIEVSRRARNNRDWYHPLDLCALVDTLIRHGDGLYHPGVFNDGLLLGLKGTMSEVELQLEGAFSPIHHILTNPVYADVYAYGRSNGVGF
jgi:hypothetical protein